MTEKWWDVTSVLYHWFRQLFPFRQILDQENKKLESMLIPAQPAGKRVVDIGIGVGNVVPYLDSSLTIVGIDVSPAMLNRVRGSFPHVHLAQADASFLPLKSSSVELVTAIGVIEYVQHVEVFFRDVATALRENGFLAVTFSPKGLFARGRLVLGHVIYPRSLGEIMTIAAANHLEVISHSASLMQVQALFRKNENNNQPSV
ncbi:MAG: class I SAM-dependent methyltransferase [Candidatus Zhuqueibacterota bacterium]